MKEASPSTICNDYLGKFRLALDDRYAMDRRIMTHGVWEPHIVQYLRYFVRPGQTCLDIGANAGYHSILLADLVGPTGRVVAFEPNPVVLPKLRTNISLNPGIASTIRLEEVALSDTPARTRGT